MESERFDPDTALGEVDRTRAQVGARARSPWWFHVGLGLLVAQQTLVGGVAGRNWTFASFAALIVGAALLVALARRSSGLTVALPPGPRSRSVMSARFVVAIGCIWAAALIGNNAVDLVLAVIAFAATAVLGVAYDEAVSDEVAAARLRP